MMCSGQNDVRVWYWLGLGDWRRKKCNRYEEWRTMQIRGNGSHGVKYFNFYLLNHLTSGKK